MPKLNDDLFTEILNQDENYITQRKSNFNLFNQKITQPKTNQNHFLSWFNFTQNRFILVGITSSIFIVVILFLGATKSANNSNLNQSIIESNSNLNDSKNELQKNQTNDTNSKLNSGDLKQQKENSQTNLKTKISGDLGESVEFSYDSNTQILSYAGFVIASNSCGKLDNVNLEQKEEKFILKYTLTSSKNICAEVNYKFRNQR
jgi:Sec-independent protein translocase protein TatA